MTFKHCYDPRAICPDGTQFIQRCKADEVLLQEMAGYPLISGYPIHKAVILLGEGGQGKTVFMVVIKNILGTKNVSEVHLHSIRSGKFASVEVYGMIANFAGNIESDKLMNAGVSKSAIGEDSLFAQRKNKDPFGFVNRAKLVFSCNILSPTNDRAAGSMEDGS